MKNERYVAIYARQSVDKKDSVSIETQIDDCKSICKEKDVIVYFDKGFSGKNTDRPQLTKLIRDIESDLISKVIVYKIDRMSRNITDFYGLYEIMKKHNCELESYNEKFDTSNAMGRGMMGILAVFAQMERENISVRIKDNYSFRIKDRRWASGKAPFGFANGKVDGKTTLIPVEEEINAVKTIFKLYATERNISIGKLQDKLAEMGLKGHQTQKGFSRTTLTRILKNPVYVEANELIYKYYERLHIQFVNDRNEWDGTTTASIVGKNNRTLNNDDKDGIRIYLTNVAPVIDAETFIIVQNRLEENSAISRDNTPNTNLMELAGLLKCAECGFAVKMQTRPTLTCNGRNQRKICDVSFKGLKLETIQENVAVQVQDRIENLDKFAKEKHTQKVKTEKEIEALQEQMAKLIEISKYSTKTAEILAKELDDLQTKINTLQLKQKLNINSHDIIEIRLKLKSIFDVDNMTLNYRALDTLTKQTVLRALVEKIYLHKDGTVNIVWKE